MIAMASSTVADGVSASGGALVQVGVCTRSLAETGRLTRARWRRAGDGAAAAVAFRDVVCVRMRSSGVQRLLYPRFKGPGWG